MIKLPKSSFVTSIFILLASFGLSAQEAKRGYRTPLGNDDNARYELRFDGSSNLPQIFATPSTNTDPNLWARGVQWACDTNGTIQFLSNEIAVYDSNYYFIANGDTTCNLLRIRSALNVPGYSMALLPVSDTKYYLLQIHMSDSMMAKLTAQVPMPMPLEHFDDILYATIERIGGVWQLTSKRKVLYNLPSGLMFHHNATAIRHANGKDWWCTFRPWGECKLLNYRISASGIEGPYEHVLGSCNWDYWLSGGAAMTYSIDGTKIAIVGHQKRGEIMLADFNRCTGMYSNTRLIAIPPDSFYVGTNVFQDSFLIGAAFSTDNKYLYVTRKGSFGQVDLSVPGQYPPFTEMLNWTNAYNNIMPAFMYYGYDSRIYLNVTQQMPFVYYIDSNEYAAPLAKLKKINTPNGELITRTYGTNYFILGADSSLCDPTAVKPTMLSSKSAISLAPNPAYTEVHVQSSGKLIQGLRVYNVQGATVIAKQTLSVSTYTIRLQDLSPDVYFVEVTLRGGERMVEKLVVE
ncbi:MAG: hypothetical protein RL660_1353 [Bacteroidota bacterium]|jgi:hypothetical protein